MFEAINRRSFLRRARAVLGALSAAAVATPATVFGDRVAWQSADGLRAGIKNADGRQPDGRAAAGKERGRSTVDDLEPKLKLSCNLYSYNHPLRSGTMTLEEVITECAEIGFDAVDPTGYYFPGYPDAPPDDYVYRIKQHAFLLGLDISGTGVRNDFAVPDESVRAADVAHVKRWVDVAGKLDAPVLRVFAGAGVPDGYNRADAFDWVVEALQDCVAYGERRGVMIVLQNHDELIKTADEVLSIRERITSDWFGLNVDIGSLRTGDPYEETALLAPHAYTWQIKETVYREGAPEKTDVVRIVGILRDAGYRGYIPLETLGEGDTPRQKLPAFFDEVRRALG